ncbi:MAG: RNA polymerase factor sigma-54, partial [Candidatus Eisenbacteria sp.]|nr:RNA polymerase factor sigma-54 [Candidatus Eisenbacteria bacterium]
DDDDERFERVPVAVATFEDELKHQLHMECEDDALVGIAEYIIGELDVDGYINDTLEEIAAALKIDVGRVEKALAVVQALDPAGVAARSIEECLLLQLQRKELGDTLAARVVSTCFEELKSCKYDAIRRKLSVSTEELREAIGEIAKLDPRPRIDPVVGDPGYITPDLVIDEVDGEFVVYLNDQDVPRVRINPTYRRILSSGAASEEREFISKKLKAARWIVQSIENRRRTMIRVTESIVRAQPGFFDKGVSALKPLTLQQIADDVGMHESTVSRVTRGKYVQTPRGTYELKYFFSSGIPTKDGDQVASKAVRDAMQEIISKEDKKKPLSDQKVAEELRRMGFRISRRAVAKYRDQMRILRAGLRKEI